MTVPSYTEEDVELAARAVTDHVARVSGLARSDGTESLPSLAAFRAIGESVLAALSSAGRLVLPGARTEWGCATLRELETQDPCRWSTREAVEEHVNCGTCVIVSRIVTPWSPSVPDTKESDDA